MTNKQLQTKIENAYTTYELTIFDLAKGAFETTIKPWLIKNKYDFLAGNGTYWIGHDIGKSGKFITIDIDSEVPENIKSCLQMEIPGLPGNDLGTLMPDFDYKKDNKNV